MLVDEGLLVPDSDPLQVELTVNASDRGHPRRTGWVASLWITVQTTGTDDPVFTQSVYEITLPEDHPTR